jgi:pimeloyl-ACP methyl ester carboxylesterase
MPSLSAAYERAGKQHNVTQNKAWPAFLKALLRGAVRLIKLVLLAYGGACLLLYLGQRSLLYFPAATHVSIRDTNFALRNGDVVLRGWILNPGQSRALLYFGGNGEAVGDERTEFAMLFPHRTIYLLAYRGYGASGGEPSEHALFSDALALFDQVRSKQTSIAVVGRSLGSGVATYLASQRPVERMALATPFDSLANVAQAHYPMFPVHWLLKDRYDSVRYVRHYNGPILVLRAGRDEVVPSVDTDRLLYAMQKAPLVMTFPSAGHNSIADAPGYAAALSEFMK